MASKLFYPHDEVIAADWRDPKRGLAAVPDDYFAHTNTDPPYSEWVHAKKMQGNVNGSGIAENRPVTFDPLTQDEIEEVSFEIVRTTRGWAQIFCADDDIRAWRDALCDAGALRWVTVIWTKPNGAPMFRGEGPSQPCEHIVNAWCGEGRPVWNGGGKMGHYAVPTEPVTTRRHETQKPLRLMKNLVLDFTMPGDLICDPYAGAGTLGMAARVCGRSFAMWERNEEHAKSARKWIEPAREQLAQEKMFHAARPGAFGDPAPPPPADQEEMEFDAAAT